MKKIVTAALTTAALILTAPAGAQGGNELKDFSVKGKVVHTNTNPPKLSIREKLFADGKLVGRDRIVCAFKPESVVCKGRFKFRDGTIVAKGEAREKKGVSILPIVDGTGRYKDVTGTFSLEQVGERRTRERFDFDR